jgi:prophage maintenance system killer protein
MAKYRDLSGTLGFTWDRTAVPRNVTGTDVRRALWRFEKMLPGYVYDAGQLEDNPFTYPEVQTLLEGITVGGRRLTDERQILGLSESAHDLIDLVRSGRFGMDKPTSDRLNLLIAQGEALEAGHFRGEGSIVTNVSVNMGRLGVHHPAPTERGGANLRRIFDQGATAILTEVSDPFEQAAAYFLFAAFQQLYYDGNKRTGRAVMSGHLMSHGIDAISVPAAWKLEFNTEMADFYASKDGTRMFGFLASCWENAQ